ncbi:MAG: HlyD family efflux transporter periplasmic adaptor subunit [Rivularia sp. (in: Bacteria)]|nr:HlyD family efflux transporter periplasmic adaptor subunit [Rivularia sp. MS3]
MTHTPLKNPEPDEYQSYVSNFVDTSNPSIDERDGKQEDVTEENSGIFYGTEELLDALPRVWTRSLLYVLVVFAAVGVPLSMVSRVDETGTAKGKVEPLGATRKLDSIAGGIVKAVKVNEGDKVQKGQILLELDSKVLESDINEAKEKLSGFKKQQSQLELLKNQLQLTIDTQTQQNKSQILEKQAQVSQAQTDLHAKQSNYNLQKLEKKAQVERAKQQIKIFENEQQAAQNRLFIDTKQVERFSKLLKDGAVSASQIDGLKKEQQESKRLYQKAASDIKQAELSLTEEFNNYLATMNQLESDIEQAQLRLQEEKSNYQSLVNAGKLALLKTQEQFKDLQAQLDLLKSQIAQTSTQIQSLNIQLQQRTVRSPIDGIIFELPVSKPGQVLQPGQRIARIAPKGKDMVIKAQMPSSETGFLKVGMPVKIKFDAYPFQEYGIGKGKVKWISPDSKQTAQGGAEIYELEIALDKPYIQNGDKRINLAPGQSATAEVIVRQRRVIDLLLDPFKKLQKGGLEL